MKSINQEAPNRLIPPMIEKLNRIRKAHAIETDPADRFKYENQIQELEKEIEELRLRS